MKITNLLLLIVAGFSLLGFSSSAITLSPISDWENREVENPSKKLISYSWEWDGSWRRCDWGCDKSRAFTISKNGSYFGTGTVEVKNKGSYTSLVVEAGGLTTESFTYNGSKVEVTGLGGNYDTYASSLDEAISKAISIFFNKNG